MATITSELDHLRRHLNLGGSVEMIPNAIAIAELAVEKQAKVLLMPVSARRGRDDAVFKGLGPRSCNRR